MGDAGSVGFRGSLDPMAEEFRPRAPYNHHQTTLVQPQIYYSYQPLSEMTVMPSSDGGGAVGFLQFPTAPPYVRASIANQPLPPPVLSPTRTLILSLVPADVSASEVRRELEVFGDVRALQMERVVDGEVTVHFYDLRDAQAATREIRKQHMQQQSRLKHYFESLLAQNLVFEPMNLVAPLPPPGRGLVAGQAVWAQFTVPSMAGVPDGHNQGSLVIFNLDSEVSTPSLLEIFEAFGPVKELRETPMKRHQRFVEFYDVRHAAKALSEMNGKEIHGKHIKIEFSRPGGYGKRFSKATQTNKFNSNNSTVYANHSGRNSIFLPLPPPPPPLQMARRSTASLPPHSLRGYANRAIQASMASLRVSGKVGNGIEESDNRLAIFKNSNKIGSASQKQQEHRVPKISRPLRGRGLANNLEPRFLINEDAILESSCRDSRTTVMIKNIPNKYSLKVLLNMLDNHCIHCNEHIVGDDQPLSSYDFVYLPIDFINKCNVGYGFVNLTSPQATWRLYKAFHLQNWEVFNSKKICQVTYARLQGVDAMKEHFKTSKFPYEVAELCLPVVFSPPRDGRQLTEPVPVVTRVYSQLTVSSENSEDDHDNGEDRPTTPVNGHNVGHLNGNGSCGGQDKEGPAAETMVALNECF